MSGTVPAEEAVKPQELGAGRRTHRSDPLGHALTTAHQAVIYRRDRSPILWGVAIGLVVALIGPR